MSSIEVNRTSWGAYQVDMTTVRLQPSILSYVPPGPQPQLPTVEPAQHGPPSPVP